MLLETNISKAKRIEEKRKTKIKNKNKNCTFKKLPGIEIRYSDLIEMCRMVSFKYQFGA
jgi:hypothetical protein